MIKNFKFSSLVAVFVLCLSSVAFGQETSGGIEGTISDPQGGVVPGVTVTITGIDQGFTRTLTTDNQGFFRAQQVPPGRYRIAAGGASGFADAVNENVVVSLGRVSPINFSLQLAGTTEQVTITASDTPAIDTTSAGKIQTNIGQQTIELLPKSPNFTSLLAVSPGTRNEPLSGGFQIDGASGSENTFIIDGQEVTNFRTGTLNINNNIPTQFVQEVQIKTSGFEAEYGGATGGVVNVVTRGGTNEFNGEIGMEFVTSELQARGRQILGASNTELFYVQPQRSGGLTTIPTVQFSGPILRDRLWFFASTQPQFIRTEQTFFNRGGQGITYKSDQRRDYANVRLDGQIVDNLRLTGTYTYNPLRINGTFPTFNEVFSNTNINSLPTPERRFQLGGRVPATNLTGQAVWTPTSRLVISARAGYGYLNEKINNYGIPAVTRIVCRTTAPSGACNAGFTSGPSNFLTQGDRSYRRTFDIDASYLVSNLGGRHQFKGGFQRNALSNDVNEGYVGLGEVRLFYGLAFPDNNGVSRGRGANEAGYGYLQDFGTSGVASSRNDAIYIQDTYQPISRLTLNLGFRTERENVPSFSETGVPINFGFGDKLIPRFGFAYDLLGNSKVVIRGSFGRFFDRFKYELPRGSFGGDVFFRYYFVIPEGQQAPLSFTRAYALANQFRGRLNFRVPANDPSQNLVDPELKPVRQTEYTVGAQFEVLKDLVLETNYKRKQLDRTIEDVGLPDAEGNETYFIANPGFGIASGSLLPGTPDFPRAERQYDALEINLNKRFTRAYYLNASYTLSRLYGNYGGLANSDEGGRTSPNVNRVFDLPFEPFTAAGEPNNGRLSTDRPHVFKFFGGLVANYTEDGFFNRLGRRFGLSSSNSTDISGTYTLQSGTPITSRADLVDVDTVVLFERGDLGRTEAFQQADLAIRHRYRFGSEGRFAVEGSLNILNLFNEANELNREDLISPEIFFPEGGPNTGPIDDDPRSPTFGLPTRSRADDIRAIFSNNGQQQVLDALRADPSLRNARYNQPDLFQAPRNVRFGFRFIF